MTGILKVDTIQNAAGSISIATSTMQRRIIQRVSYTHRTGWWRSDNTYYWIAGGFIDMRPIRSDSRIRISFNIPTRQYGGSQHSITHWIFYVNDVEYGRHTRGGHHTENAFTQEWDVPSWGANQFARAGYKTRAYSDGSHNAHYFHTQYWDGGGSTIDNPGIIIAEEYTPAPT
jgi:hypothetical protein